MREEVLGNSSSALNRSAAQIGLETSGVDRPALRDLAFEAAVDSPVNVSA